MSITIQEPKTRITTRLPINSHAILEEAAAFLGVPLNSFLISAAMEKAEHILAGERIIKLGRKDAELMEKLMEKPPAPNTELLKAVDAYKRHIS